MRIGADADTKAWIWDHAAIMREEGDIIGKFKWLMRNGLEDFLLDTRLTA